MIRTPLRPLARILKARDKGENPDAIEAENIRLRREDVRDKSRQRAEGRLLVMGAMFALAYGAIGMQMAALAGTAPEEPEARSVGNPIIGQRADIRTGTAVFWRRTLRHFRFMRIPKRWLIPRIRHVNWRRFFPR